MKLFHPNMGGTLIPRILLLQEATPILDFEEHLKGTEFEKVTNS